MLIMSVKNDQMMLDKDISFFFFLKSLKCHSNGYAASKTKAIHMCMFPFSRILLLPCFFIRLMNPLSLCQLVLGHGFLSGEHPWVKPLRFFLISIWMQMGSSRLWILFDVKPESDAYSWAAQVKKPTALLATPAAPRSLLSRPSQGLNFVNSLMLYELLLNALESKT